MSKPETPEIPGESELVGRARKGDRDAYAELVRRHSPRIFALCLSMLRRRESAEDAAQEAFVKAWKGLRRFRGGAAFSTWVHRIAANACQDFLRRHSRAREESIEGPPLGDERRLRQAANALGDQAAKVEAADLVGKILARLSSEHRLILVLREAQGFNYAEIAEILDCSLDAVKGRLKRARQSLEENMRHFSSRGGV